MAEDDNKQADYLLDITKDRCPMTFVKTRLTLDKMQSGDTLCVRLKGEEPLKNVPRSAKELGHLVAEPILEENGVTSINIEKV
jgi:tRNA 2-thiouridine synthesizing protein A